MTNTTRRGFFKAALATPVAVAVASEAMKQVAPSPDIPKITEQMIKDEADRILRGDYKYAQTTLFDPTAPKQYRGTISCG